MHASAHSTSTQDTEQEQRRASAMASTAATATSSTEPAQISTKQTLITIIEFEDDRDSPTQSTVSTTVEQPTSYWDLPTTTSDASTSSTVVSSNEVKVEQDLSTVHLVLTEATLLSGNLDECFDAQDEDCEGGVAAVSAFVRHLIPKDQPRFVFPKFEKQSQFVQVHPLGWSVNRLILQGVFQWKALMSTPSLLLQNGRDGYGNKRDLSYLQDADFPFVLTNVDVPPSNSWAIGYHKYVYFDQDTHIALLSIANSGEPLTHDQVKSAWGSLFTIADRNIALGCTPPQDPQQQAIYDSYQEIYFQSSRANYYKSTTRCWIPVVFFDDNQPGHFQDFIQGIMQHPYPPALIVDVEKNKPDEYPIPTLVDVPIQQETAANSNSNSTSTTLPAYRSVWIHSFGRKDDIYYQHQIHLSDDFPTTVTNVTLIQQDMEVVPEEFRDDLYAQHIQYLRQQADQAIQNDPQVGFSTEFPVVRDGEYRRCQGGECEIGNLFTDALRWKAGADVAFVTSGGLRGDGWPAGPVRISSIWAALPFPNGLCGTLCVSFLLQ